MEERNYFLTRRGLEKIKDELKKLEEIRNRKLKEETPSIFHSEEINPEYLSFKEELEFLEKRILQLKHILENSKIIKPPSKNNRCKVNLGAKVLVEVNGKEREFIIVGSLEADPSCGKISNESEIGKALLGRKIGDIVFCSQTKKILKIKNIKYEKV